MRNVATVTLSNGLKVANFSSPHSFVFEDASVLPAVEEELADDLSMDVEEEFLDTKYAIKVNFRTNCDVKRAISAWHEHWLINDVDVVIVPRPVIDALRHEGWSDDELLHSPFRTIRIVRRKSHICSINKFCI